MGDVIDLFTRQSMPAAEHSDFVTEFVENQLGDFLATVEALHESEDETEFRKYLNDLRYQTARWSI